MPSCRRHQTMSALRACGIVAIIRTEDPGDLVAVARALARGGVRFIEITLTVPGAIGIIRSAAVELARDEVWIGAGTVLDVAAAAAAIDAGAGFIVSPGFDAETVRLCNLRGVPVMPGALTPTEVIAAWKGGADAVKLFPIDAVGGPAYIRALRGPLPQIELLPTGGIDAASAGAHLAAGACAVGVGGSLVGRDLIAAKAYDRITAQAQTLSAAVAAARSGQTRP